MWNIPTKWKYVLNMIYLLFHLFPWHNITVTFTACAQCATRFMALLTFQFMSFRCLNYHTIDTALRPHFPNVEAVAAENFTSGIPKYDRPLERCVFYYYSFLFLVPVSHFTGPWHPRMLNSRHGSVKFSDVIHFIYHNIHSSVIHINLC
jgi:hypothetical protein